MVDEPKVNNVKQEKITFLEPIYLHTNSPCCKVQFMQPYSIISIEIEPDIDHTAGLIAGSEGLGCEWFTNDKGQVYAIDLSLPFEFVDILPTTTLVKPCSSIRSRARTAAVMLGNFPKVSLLPTNIWIPQSFESALFVFEDIPLMPIEKFVEYVDELLICRIASCVTVGIDQETYTLRLVLVDTFDEYQDLYGHTLSKETLSAPLLNAFKKLHAEFYSFTKPNLFASNALRIVEEVEKTIESNSLSTENTLLILKTVIAQYTKALERMHNQDLKS